MVNSPSRTINSVGVFLAGISHIYIPSLKCRIDKDKPLRAYWERWVESDPPYGIFTQIT